MRCCPPTVAYWRLALSMCILTAAGRTRSFSQYDQGLSTVVLATFRGIWQTFLQVARATSYPRSRKFGCLCGSGVGGDTEVVEEGLHVDAQGFVLPVDAGPVGGFGSKPGAADPGQDGADDLIAQGQ